MPASEVPTSAVYSPSAAFARWCELSSSAGDEEMTAEHGDMLQPLEPTGLAWMQDTSWGIVGAVMLNTWCKTFLVSFVVVLTPCCLRFRFACVCQPVGRRRCVDDSSTGPSTRCRRFFLCVWLGPELVVLKS